MRQRTARCFRRAHFFGVVYSESLFLLTLVGAVLALRRRQWGWAALSGIAMTATRVNGVMLVPGLLVVAWLSAHPTRGDRLRGLAAAAAASAGVAVFSVYAYAVSGDPLAWYHSIERWGYYPGGNPAIALVLARRGPGARAGPFFQHESDGPRTTPSTCSRPSSRWRCCRWSGGDSTSATRPSSRSGSCCRSRRVSTEGLARYAAVLFPLPLLAGSLVGDTKHLALLTASTMIYTLHLVLFVNVHPLF